MGVLPPVRPAAGELRRFRWLAVEPPPGAGVIRHAGTDPAGNEIFFLENRSRFEVLERALRQVCRELGVSTGDVVWVDTMPRTNLWLRAGGFAAQLLRLAPVGKALSLPGALFAYRRLAELVEHTRRALARSPGGHEEA